MGAFNLARLMAKEALRRPRSVLATIMLALSAGFVVLPDPGANYATMTFHGQPLVYTPAVMGVIAGEMFVAFSMVLVVLAMSALAPLRAWRAVFGVAAAPSWKLSLGLWLAAFGAGLFLLTCIFAGALVRASDVLTATGNWPGALWIFFTWTYGLGIVGAAFAAAVYSVLALRLATHPALLMGATFLAFIFWVAAIGVGLSDVVDVDGRGFAIAQLFPAAQEHDLGMGFLFGQKNKVAVHARDVSDLVSTPGGPAFLATRAILVLVAASLALLLSGPHVAPLVPRNRNWTRGLSALTSMLSTRFGLAGIIVGQVWNAQLWALVLVAAAVGAEVYFAPTPQIAVIPLGFAWGLYMLRWPELTEVFEQGGLRSLVQPSVLGPWPIRFHIAVNIAVQMALLALPLVLVLAASGRVHGLVWLGTQIAAAPLLCVGLARVRGGATIFSLLAMAWWYLMISGNAVIPPG